MEITVERFVSDSQSTVSHVKVDGKFVCFGLEDEYRAVKVAGETRIPAGTYKVGLRTEGKHHQEYKTKFPAMHRGMLHVLNVPNFEYILIHIGNFEKDTEGCLLVGTAANTETHPMSISSSKVAYEKLYPMVVDAASKGTLSIVYQDKDR